MLFQPKYSLGDVLPDLLVTDVHDQPAQLSQQMGSAGLLVYVIRGTWCPFCVLQIRTMQRRYSVYTSLGVNTVFIVPEAQTTVWSFQISSPRPLPFPLYPDEQKTIANDLTTIPETAKERPLGIYLLNPERRIVWRYVGTEADDFPSQDTMLAAIREHLALQVP